MHAPEKCQNDYPDDKAHKLCSYSESRTEVCCVQLKYNEFGVMGS